MNDENGAGGYRDEIYSKSVRAGKRTYFFDIKSTRGGDLYVTITESKKKFNADGKFYFEKHKIFLYKEDFEKFSDGLNEVISEIDRLKATGDYPAANESYTGGDNNSDEGSGSVDVSFEDL
ncbi:PUR family DNA/RNA-binding protein [Parvicella tangerina]|uniref:DUF3276 family protein n=1 Tax=Parvicella tangerina TaxID=2829795 RepID=A0A916JMR4_9FLAO|nr:PUR family DNA/RNA-binding protein [Parvicella tangerina]CAG5080805.1 hypothetical protein CRYO30217_01449 [Parvicella tangerina]